MDKTYIDPDVGTVLLRKNLRSRRITLRVNPRKGVTVTMPYLVPFRAGIEFFKSKKGWVLDTLERQRRKMNDEPVPSAKEIEAMRKKAKEVLPARLAELAEEYSFKYNQVRIT